jgi:hypothetical protein
MMMRGRMKTMDEKRWKEGKEGKEGSNNTCRQLEGQTREWALTIVFLFIFLSLTADKSLFLSTHLSFFFCPPG